MHSLIILLSFLFLAYTLMARPTDLLKARIKRDDQITFTMFNDCDESVQPIFDPSLPGRETTSQHVIKPKHYQTLHFTSNDYRGFIYTRIRGSKMDGKKNTTHGQFDIATGKYAISM